MNLDTSKMVNMMAFLIAILTPSIVSSGKWQPLYLYEMANNYDYSSVYLEHLSIWLLQHTKISQSTTSAEISAPKKSSLGTCLDITFLCSHIWPFNQCVMLSKIKVFHNPHSVDFVLIDKVSHCFQESSTTYTSTKKLSLKNQKGHKIDFSPIKAKKNFSSI